jgi:hypothetical protein
MRSASRISVPPLNSWNWKLNPDTHQIPWHNGCLLAEIREDKRPFFLVGAHKSKNVQIFRIDLLEIVPFENGIFLRALIRLVNPLYRWLSIAAVSLRLP